MTPDAIREIDHEHAVNHRYGAAAHAREAALCCPTNYDATALKVIPDEIVERDYGCGDPSQHVSAGETVVDLGSGAGKICYILSQRVGPNGRVLGVDVNDEMLGLAREHQETIARRIGYSNVEFVKARIQDMRLDLDAFEDVLKTLSIKSLEGFECAQAEAERIRRTSPAVPSEFADVVVSNCVLNLVRPADKKQLFAEIFRILKVGGRAVISDIVCDEPPTLEMQHDSELWSGCISGAFIEAEFLTAFEEAGFYGVEILERAPEPWQTVQGIEFRSMTVRAYKGKQGPCFERNQAVVYAGPFKSVTDDDGHSYPRGERIAVCDKTYRLLTNPGSPYRKSMIPIEPRIEIPLETAHPFGCDGLMIRHPRVTKGEDYQVTESGSANCTGDSCC